MSKPTKKDAKAAIQTEMDSVGSGRGLSIANPLCKIYPCRRCPWSMFSSKDTPIGCLRLLSDDERLLATGFMLAAAKDFSEG